MKNGTLGTRVLLLLVCGSIACANTAGQRIDLDARYDETLARLGIAEVAVDGPNRFVLLDTDGDRLGSVVLEADGRVVSELGTAHSTVSEAWSGMDVTCNGVEYSFERDDTGEWIGYDVPTVTELLAPCSDALDAGSVVRDAAADATGLERQSQPLCSAATEDAIYRAYHRYQARCIGWGYYGAIWHRDGCMIILDRCY